MFPATKQQHLCCNSHLSSAISPLQELGSITDPDERVGAEKRVKSRTLGTVRLIAELYRKEVVKEAIIVVCLRELLEVRMKRVISRM